MGMERRRFSNCASFMPINIDGGKSSARRGLCAENRNTVEALTFP
jgi:hypothetical protein